MKSALLASRRERAAPTSCHHVDEVIWNKLEKVPFCSADTGQRQVASAACEIAAVDISTTAPNARPRPAAPERFPTVATESGALLIPSSSTLGLRLRHCLRL